MDLTGKHIINGREQAERGGDKFTVSNSATGEVLAPEFVEAGANEVDECLQAADKAFDELQTVPWEKIAELLEAIAAEIDALGAPLLERAHAETALPMGRLEGERARTTNNCRFFAAMVRDGSWLQARIDHADSARKPLPKPDVRAMLMGVGPVAVFGASNFPLAISVAGTDTISAFAARCPAIVKGHPAHPGTCEMVAWAVARAIKAAGLPPGMFGFIQGTSHEVGRELVYHPLTQAVAFTGSLRGGRALMDVAATRPRPIPVYAEMGSINPVFLLPSALAERGPQIAEGYIQSVALGVGQFCTNPGMVLGVAGESLDAFIAGAAAAAAKVAPATMLHPGIHAAYQQGINRIAAHPGVQTVAESSAPANEQKHEAAVRIFAANSSEASYKVFNEEVFGPASVVFRCESIKAMRWIAEDLDCHLTATIHGTEKELLENADLVRILQRKVGRLIFNGFPTGIEVCPSMHHGGPYPATSHSHFTSIGHASIYRFTRPVCYQGFPESALPPELQDANPRELPRIVDGRYT